MTADELRRDPDAAASRPARSLGRDRHAVAPRRPALAHDRDDRGRAGPRGAAAHAAGRPLERRRRARRADPGDRVPPRDRSWSRAAARASTAPWRRPRSCARRCAPQACRGASARAGRPSRPRRSRPRSRTSSAAGGLVIGISHEGGDVGDEPGARAGPVERRRDRARHRQRAVARGAARPTSSSRPAELDQSWCHTIGYLSPILAATAVGAPPLGPAGRPGGRPGRARRRACAPTPSPRSSDSRPRSRRSSGSSSSAPAPTASPRASSR